MLFEIAIYDNRCRVGRTLADGVKTMGSAPFTLDASVALVVRQWRDIAKEVRAGRLNFLDYN
jgi:hypothetical protein